jgi:hypothetical protein
MSESRKSGRISSYQDTNTSVTKRTRLSRDNNNDDNNNNMSQAATEEKREMVDEDNEEANTSGNIFQSVPIVRTFYTDSNKLEANERNKLLWERCHPDAQQQCIKAVYRLFIFKG